jgi:hypothetical protein
MRAGGCEEPAGRFSVGPRYVLLKPPALRRRGTMRDVQIAHRITQHPATIRLAHVAKGTQIRPLNQVSVAVTEALTNPAELERDRDDRP